MKKWEIDIHEVAGGFEALKRTVGYINKMGQEGWEPASVSLECGMYLVTLKREIPETPAAEPQPDRQHHVCGAGFLGRRRPDPDAG